MEDVKFMAYLLAGGIILGSFTFFTIRYLVNKTLDGLDSNSKKITDLQIQQTIHNQEIEHIKIDLCEYKKIVQSSNDSIRNLDATIQKFDTNAKNQHSEMKTVLETNSRVMQEVMNSLKK